jgi:hypothetical protein
VKDARGGVTAEARTAYRTQFSFLNPIIFERLLWTAFALIHEYGVELEAV